MDLEANLRADLLAYLPAPDRDVGAWLNSMPTARLLECFLTLRGRLIHPHPRALKISAELPASPFFASREADIRAIWQKTTQGIDLTPHLSRRIGTSYLQYFRRPRDLDILLSEWNIHHLHISGLIGPKGYTERGNYLLFVMFHDDAAYFLDILPRAGWRLQRLAEIAIRNWPTTHLWHKLAGGIPEHQGTARERSRSRNGGLHKFILVDGEPYVSNSYGIPAGSSPSEVTVASMKLLGLIQYFAENQISLEQEIRSANARFVVDWPLIPQFHLIIARTARTYEFVVMEDRTKLMMSLGI